MRELGFCVLSFLLLTSSVCGRKREHHRRHMPQTSQSWEVVVPPTILAEKSASYILPTSDNEVEYKITHHKDYDEIQSIVATEEFLCTKIECGPGHVCRQDDYGIERCVCAPERSCPIGHSLVCGSDGKLYESHCELHRSACITGVKIYVDKAGEACIRKDLLTEKTRKSKNLDVNTPSKKKDLSRTADNRNRNHMLYTAASTSSATTQVENLMISGSEQTRASRSTWPTCRATDYNYTAFINLDSTIPNSIACFLDSSLTTMMCYVGYDTGIDMAVDLSEMTTETPYLTSEHCNWEKFEEFKDLLEIHHCNRLDMIKCNSQGTAQRRSLVMAMFKYYDRDSDTLITTSELEYAQRVDHVERLALVCSLPDIVRFSTGDENNGYIDSTTFLHAFGIRASTKPSPVITFSSGGVRMTAVTADGYEGAELICSLPDTTDIGWKRNGITLDLDNTDGYTLMSAGRLYISSVNLAHTGNYTCFHRHQPQSYQTQQLTVQVKPVIRTLDVGKVMEGVSTPLRCHSDGVPEPKAEWQVAQYELPDDRMRYDWTNENSTVYILSPDIDYDSAEYECLAKSMSGWSLSTSRVLVQRKSVFAKESSQASKGQYVVFHDEGYTSYEADHCYTTHSIEKDVSDFTHNLQGDSSGTLRRLCPLKEPCQWGSVVSVNDDVIYAAQPSLYRVVVIDTKNNMRPKYVIPLNAPVKSLDYVVGTDELWILMGSQPQFQTIMVVSDASRGYPIDVHPLLPQHNIFNSIEQVFVPPLNSFNRTSRYVWSTAFEQFGLNRLDIVSMSTKGHVDLVEWKCLPERVHFLAIGGLLLVECQNSTNTQTNLLVDSITNQVIGRFQPGRIYVSPNTRYIVVTSPPRSITMYHVEDNGSIQFMRDHKLEIEIGTLSFMDSKISAGFDLAVTSPDENSVLFMDIKSTRTQVLEGLLSGRELTTPKSDAEHLVATSGEFGYHILIPSRGALFIVNKQYHLISCEWTDIKHMQRSVWVYT